MRLAGCEQWQPRRTQMGQRNAINLPITRVYTFLTSKYSQYPGLGVGPRGCIWRLPGTWRFLEIPRPGFFQKNRGYKSQKLARSKGTGTVTRRIDWIAAVKYPLFGQSSPDLVRPGNLVIASSGLGASCYRQGPGFNSRSDPDYPSYSQSYPWQHCSSTPAIKGHRPCGSLPQALVALQRQALRLHDCSLIGAALGALEVNTIAAMYAEVQYLPLVSLDTTSP